VHPSTFMTHRHRCAATHCSALYGRHCRGVPADARFLSSATNSRLKFTLCITTLLSSTLLLDSLLAPAGCFVLVLGAAVLELDTGRVPRHEQGHAVVHGHGVDGGAARGLAGPRRSRSYGRRGRRARDAQDAARPCPAHDEGAASEPRDLHKHEHSVDIDGGVVLTVTAWVQAQRLGSRRLQWHDAVERDVGHGLDEPHAPAPLSRMARLPRASKPSAPPTLGTRTALLRDRPRGQSSAAPAGGRNIYKPRTYGS